MKNFADENKKLRREGSNALLTFFAIFVLWTIIALLTASQIHITNISAGRANSWINSFFIQVITWYPWILYTHIAVWLSKKIDIERISRIKITSTFWGIILLFLLINNVFVAITNVFVESQPLNFATFFPRYFFFFVRNFFQHFILFGSIFGILYALDFYKKFKDRELQASLLETKLVNAQLSALKMQLHPHFLFNTLNAISVLIRKGENKDAAQMITGLGDLLRYALENVGVQTVPLKQELDVVKKYLDIENIRFKDRLKVQMEIDNETLTLHVPNLILQPLVENAIKHGISKSIQSGVIGIKAQLQGENLVLIVEDDGPGLSKTPKNGLGIANTKERLAQLYGEKHQFSIADNSRGGVKVEVKIPAITQKSGTVNNS